MACAFEFTHRVFRDRGSTLMKTTYRILNWLSSGTGCLCSQPPAYVNLKELGVRSAAFFIGSILTVYL